MGYPAPGMRNYLTRLGWSHGNDEFFSDAQAREWFDLDGIGKSPARLDFKKLANISGQHIAAAQDAELIVQIEGYLEASGQLPLSDAQKENLLRAMYCLKERAKTLPELLDKASFILSSRPLDLDEKAVKALDPVYRGILAELTPQLQNASWTREDLEAIVSTVAQTHGLGLGKLAAPLRAALAGRSVCPSIFDMMLILGKDETLARLNDQVT